MTSPNYALPAAKHLEIADRLVCTRVNKRVLMQHDLPVGARVFLALAAFEEWVQSPRSIALASARDAELAAVQPEQVAS